MLTNIIEKSGDSSDGCQYGVSGGESQGRELRERKWHNPRESLPNTLPSTNKRPQEMDTQYLTPFSGNISRAGSPSQTRSLSSTSSTVVENPFVRSTEPDQRIFRKDTASWFEQGKLFEVSPNTTAAMTNAGVAGCPLLVVMYRRGSSITCLPLRRHSSVTQRNVDFLKSRIRIYARGKQTVDTLPECHWKPLPVDIEIDSELMDDMWINIERSHTIENVQEVDVALWGVLDDDSFDTLRNAYLSSQLRNISSPREKPQATLLWHLQFIFRRIWAAFLWVFERYLS